MLNQMKEETALQWLSSFCVQINLQRWVEYVFSCYQFNQRIIWKQKIKQQ